MQDQICSAAELVGALDALDVPFLTNGAQTERALALTPAELLQGLAQSSEARVRSAIIPLLLRHPEFADGARLATARLQGQPQFTLELFYTAALLLQKKYAARLARLFGAQETLSDLFSATLQIELTNDVEQALACVGERHTLLSGLRMNWTGGYEHAARTWLDYVEFRARRKRERTWQTA